MRFAHDGRLVSAGRDNTVKTWGGDGAAQKSFPAFTEPRLRCAFTHDGKRVIGGDWLGNVRVWDAAKAAELFALTANPPTLAMRLEIAKKELAAQEALAATAASLSAAAEKLVAEREAQLKAASADLSAKSKATAEARAALEKAQAALQAAVADEQALQQAANLSNPKADSP